jgi:hypothetical protein
VTYTQHVINCCQSGYELTHAKTTRKRHGVTADVGISAEGDKSHAEKGGRKTRKKWRPIERLTKRKY